MTAVAGVWNYSEARNPNRAARAMLAAQRQYGPHDESLGALGQVAFGRALYRMLPEDAFDRQPLIEPSGRWMLVADVRIDNRDELLGDLGCAQGAKLSDSEVLFSAWLRWGESALSRLLGDYAFAVWDARERALSLVRDPAGQRPLHYHLGRDFVAFSSMPQGLHALPEVPRRLDQEQLAAFVADLQREAGATYFEGIRRVEPGQLLKIDPAGIKARRYWQIPDREIRFPNDSDYFEAFREQLDRATKARLRGAGSRVGAHLSAGLDSSAVAATAARLTAREGGRVVAFTSAPRLGFSGPVLRPRIGDESGIAAIVAEMYPNMDHVIIRPEGLSPLDLMGRDAELFQEPVGHACNTVWWSAIHDAARERGISVMLSGEAGNLTTSAGSLPMLAEYVRTGRWLRWWREARAIAGKGPSWKGVLATSFGPWTPRGILRLLTRAVANDPGVGPPLFHPALRSLVAARAADYRRDSRPPIDNKKMRWEIFQQHEPANFRKGILARWGVDERDPTADRRLAEFCFSVPVEQLFSGGISRRLARLALSDRLPDEVLQAPRGYQYADWYELIDRPALDRSLADLAAGPAASLLDLDALRDRVSTWPTSDWNTIENIGKYRHAFLMAVSAGSFVNRMSAPAALPHQD